VGKVYLQTAIDCHSRYAWARLYPNKLPVTAVQLLNNDVLPTFEAHKVEVEAVLSDISLPSTRSRGREFCGRDDQHPYELFLQLEGIEHRRTQVKRPQTNGIVERLHRTQLDEHFRVEGRRTWFETIEEMQTSLDAYLKSYNENRPHQGRGMKGRTPLQAFRAGIKLSKAKKEEPRTDAPNDTQPRPPDPAYGCGTVRGIPSLYILQTEGLPANRHPLRQARDQLPLGRRTRRSRRVLAMNEPQP